MVKIEVRELVRMVSVEVRVRSRSWSGLGKGFGKELCL